MSTLMLKSRNLDSLYYPITIKCAMPLQDLSSNYPLRKLPYKLSFHLSHITTPQALPKTRVLCAADLINQEVLA